jgi:hypothetical protein
MIIKPFTKEALSKTRSLFTDDDQSNTHQEIHFTDELHPLKLQYTTRYSGNRSGSIKTYYARLALLDPNCKLPLISNEADGLYTEIEPNEIGLREFAMDHYPYEERAKIYSGMHIRQEYEGYGYGSLLIGLTHQTIDDLILRFLKDVPETHVYAFISDASYANNDWLTRSGWTSYQALKLGYQPLKNKKGFPKFMKRYPVKQILANSANN